MLTTLAALLLAQAAPVAAASGCASAAPAVGQDPLKAFPDAIDGRTLKSLRDVARLRARSGDRLLVIRGGDFSRNKVGKLKLSNICFIDSKLSGSDWRGAEASGLGFIRSDLSGAVMTGARLPRVLLRESNLADVDASRAVMDGGRLDGGWNGSLARLKLDGARLARFQVVCGTREEDGCPFERAGMSIRGTDFSRANLATFSFWDTVLDGAILDNTHVGMQQIGQLDRLVVRGPIIVHSRRRYATLQPDEYLAVRQGVRPVVKAAAQAETAAPVDPASCAATADRRDKAICLGGASLRLASLEAQRRDRTAAEAAAFATRQSNCVNLSDDLVGRCLARLYRAESAAAKPAASGKGERLSSAAMFASLPVRFAEGFNRSPLYLRMLPLFIDSSPTQLTAVPLANGSVGLRGGSQGGCRVAATDLRFNSATGWYGEARSVRLRKGARPVVRWTPVVRFTAGTAEFADKAEGVVQCPTGTTLDPVQRIIAPDDLLDILTEAEPS